MDLFALIPEIEQQQRRRSAPAVWDSEVDAVAALRRIQPVVVIWKVTGELTTDSGSGGRETWFYMTNNPLQLPDLTATFYAGNCQGGNVREWYRIESVTAVSVR